MKNKMIKGLSAGVLALMLAACSSSSAASTGKYTAGTYTGTGKGNNGDVTVEVVFTADAIKSVTVKDNSETAGISDPAIEQIPSEIVDQQSLAVDTVSGATHTSDAIIEAVSDCVTQAGGDPASLK
ncbi:MAG: FMN-binding protein [Solobacterium sp.]|jgi:fumarate reductase flavoprotein subunit|nr:FMN-binding protein [Solobacterium sp.]MCH4265879.1 FMN-binding protein [Solobacterium sp.]